MAVGIKISSGCFVIADKALVLVENTDKVKRDFNKFLLTEKVYPGNETTYTRYNENYGVELNRTDLYRNLPVDTIMDNMSLSLKSSLKWYVQLQESRANLSEGEIIRDIKFQISRDENSVSKIKFKVSLLIYNEDSYTTLGTYSQQV